ncbi:MAG: hypothetical protein LBB04_03500 [Oscillospiraceae bacterium]|jgi:hypothetical protein|nr:hypothetical protein [Oscillospiraceae bacterium]
MKKTKKIMALGLAAIMTVGATGFTANAGRPSKKTRQKVREAAAKWDSRGTHGLELFTGVFHRADTKHKPDQIDGAELLVQGALFAGAPDIGRLLLPESYHGQLEDIGRCGYLKRRELQEYVASCLRGHASEDFVIRYPAFGFVRVQVAALVRKYDGLLNRTEKRYGVKFDRTELYTDLIQVTWYSRPAAAAVKTIAKDKLNLT